MYTERSFHFEFRKRPRILIKEFQPWMIQAAWEHVNDGWSFRSFAGKHGICTDAWCDWSQMYPELQEVNDTYKARYRLRFRR